jgi:methyl-accepting chemotaxis protein
VAELLQQIDAASAGQAAGIAGVRKVIADMDQATRQNAAMVEEAAASAETMRVQAGELTEVVATFKVGGEGGRTARYLDEDEDDDREAALPALVYA